MFFFQALCVWEPGCCRYRAPLHSVSQLTRGGCHCWAVLPVLISERGGHDCAGRVGDKPRDNVGKGGGGVAEMEENECVRQRDGTPQRSSEEAAKDAERLPSCSCHANWTHTHKHTHKVTSGLHFCRGTSMQRQARTGK